MRFRPAIFIAFVFAQFFFKLYNNGGNQKLKAWSFQLRKNYFCTLNIERPRTHQNSITISLIHPVVLKKAFERSQRFDCNVLYSFENFGYIFMSQNDDESQNQLFNHILYPNRLANHISFILYMCVMQPIEFCNLLTVIRSTTDHL